MTIHTNSADPSEFITALKFWPITVTFQQLFLELYNKPQQPLACKSLCNCISFPALCIVLRIYHVHLKHIACSSQTTSWSPNIFIFKVSSLFLHSGIPFIVYSRLHLFPVFKYLLRRSHCYNSFARSSMWTLWFGHNAGFSHLLDDRPSNLNIICLNFWIQSIKSNMKMMMIQQSPPFPSLNKIHFRRPAKKSDIFYCNNHR